MRTFLDSPNRLSASLDRLAVPLAKGLVLLAILLVPILLLARGYFPTDDCLRHAAKAVDGRPWAEILVLRPGLLADPHAAWHGLLRALHLALGWGPEELVVLTVGFLFLLVLCAPLPWLRAPEAWLGSWVAVWVAGGGQMRLLQGRPFLVAMAALLALMALWTRGRVLGAARRWGLTLLLFTAAALLHGSWYLLALVPAAFLLARRWREAGALGLAWAGGSVLAGLLTGHPVQFLGGQLVHLGHALDPGAGVGPLVTELGPSMGGGAMGLVLLGALAWGLRGNREDRVLRDPVFLLALLGWLLGLAITRFWLDWGLPCAALWLAFRLEPLLVRLGRRAPRRRLGLAAGIGLAALLLIPSADDRRWADRVPATSITLERPDLRDWVPGDGGILYAGNMAVFYDTFYRNPGARWRYILGFEPTMMPPEDLRVFNRIARAYDNPAAFRPWIERMRPEDRLAYVCATSPQGLFPQLQWRPVGRGTWLGRTPRVGN